MVDQPVKLRWEFAQTYDDQTTWEEISWLAGFKEVQNAVLSLQAWIPREREITWDPPL